jgi:hypothetical protein
MWAPYLPSLCVWSDNVTIVQRQLIHRTTWEWVTLSRRRMWLCYEDVFLELFYDIYLHFTTAIIHNVYCEIKSWDRKTVFEEIVPLKVLFLSRVYLGKWSDGPCSCSNLTSRIRPRLVSAQNIYSFFDHPWSVFSVYVDELVLGTLCLAIYPRVQPIETIND